MRTEKSRNFWPRVRHVSVSSSKQQARGPSLPHPSTFPHYFLVIAGEENPGARRREVEKATCGKRGKGKGGGGVGEILAGEKKQT